jgi:hypothetical protein
VITVMATWLQVPSTARYLVRRTAGFSLALANELGATVFPNMPGDRVAWSAWETGYLADLQQPEPVTGLAPVQGSIA